jgi:hypothetical protein
MCSIFVRNMIIVKLIKAFSFIKHKYVFKLRVQRGCLKRAHRNSNFEARKLISETIIAPLPEILELLVLKLQIICIQLKAHVHYKTNVKKKKVGKLIKIENHIF